MKYIVGFCRFWYDFIVGDDWTVAAGVVLALALAAALAHHGMAAWWVVPAAILAVLAASIRRVARR
jgi:hypothetical protein